MEKKKILTKDANIRWIGDGLGFKDYDAYENDWDKVCYIPEAATIDEYIEESDMYTHNDLLKLCKECPETKWRYKKACDCMFDELDWCCPETFLDEINF